MVLLELVAWLFQFLADLVSESSGFVVLLLQKGCSFGLVLEVMRELYW